MLLFSEGNWGSDNLPNLGSDSALILEVSNIFIQISLYQYFPKLKNYQLNVNLSNFLKGLFTLFES